MAYERTMSLDVISLQMLIVDFGQSYSCWFSGVKINQHHSSTPRSLEGDILESNFSTYFHVGLPLVLSSGVFLENKLKDQKYKL